MRFTVYKGDMNYMSTEHVSCIPFQYLDDMARAGYKFRLDDKVVSAATVKKLRESAPKSTSATASAPASTENDNNAATIIDNKSTTDNKPRRKVKKVYCKETDTTYSNMSAAGRALNIDPAAISYAISVGRPTTSGYSFTVVED